MANFTIITNNPLVESTHSSISDYRECSVADIFLALRNAIHMGGILISHPLAGSLKPNENPYKSVVISTRTGSLDDYSLTLIEGALDVLRRMPVKNRPLSERVLEDFRVIDLDLINSAIIALPAEYHR